MRAALIKDIRPSDHLVAGDQIAAAAPGKQAARQPAGAFYRPVGHHPSGLLAQCFPAGFPSALLGKQAARKARLDRIILPRQPPEGCFTPESGHRVRRLGCDVR